jgi:calcium-dependent protein kinase
MDCLDHGLLSNLKEFEGHSVLKKAALNVFVKMLTPKQIMKLKKQFEKIDTDHTGYINSQELYRAMTACNMEIPAQEIDTIITEVDYQGNKKINYSEFIAATIQTKEILNDSKLMILFKEFDVDNSGKITKPNLKEAFLKFERSLSIEELDEIMDKHDKAKDGEISYDEFKLMLFGDTKDTDSEEFENSD